MTHQGALFLSVSLGDGMTPIERPALPDGTPVMPVDRTSGWTGIAPHVVERFLAWMKTPSGRTVYAEIERRVLVRARNGERRIPVNAITEDVRKEGVGEGPVAINNSLRSGIARAILQAHPWLGGQIEIRVSRGRRKGSG